MATRPDLKLIENATYRFDSVAEMVAATFLEIGDVVETLGYYSSGDGGGNLYKIVAAATGIDDGGSYIDLSTHQSQALFSDLISVKQFGAKGDNDADDTISIMNAYSYVGTSAFGGILFIPDGDYYITDQSGGIALDWSDGYQNLKVKMAGTFQYKTGTGVALRIGNGTRMWECIFEGLRVYATAQTPFENLVGTGIQLINMGESTFKDCRVQGFLKGYAFEPNAEGAAVTINNFFNINSQSCYYNIYMEPGDFDVCFVTSNKFYGGYQVTDQSQFTDIVSANAHLVSIRNPYNLTRVSNTVDGNTFNGMTIEQNVTRKVYCEGNNNQFVGCYFDAGSIHVGNPHASNTFPYAETSGITGFTSNGTNVITKVAHGLLPYVRQGDQLRITSSADVSDMNYYVVTAIDTDTITLNNSMAGTGSITLEHWSTNIEFSATGFENSIRDCNVIGLNIVTCASSDRVNTVQGPRWGISKGPLPHLGSSGNDSFPAGLTASPQPSLFSFVDKTYTGAGTMNAYIGNANDQDTDANTQLCFIGTDSNDRLSVFSSVLANKEGRSPSQPHGGIKLRTRASGSASYLIDRFEVDSNGEVSVKGDHFRIDTPKTPATAADIGTAGQVAWDTNFVYICVATNTWKRVAIASW